MARSSPACDQMYNHKIPVLAQCKRRTEAWDQVVDLDLADHRITNSSKFNAFGVVSEKRRKKQVPVA